MAVRPILRMGDPVLLARAEPIGGAPDIAALESLVADMVETMEAAPGIGLAGPQIGVSRRILVFRVPEARASGAEGDGPEPAQVLIDPEVEPLDEEIAQAWEGCLSIPGLRGLVPRPCRIRYRGWTLIDGRLAPVEREASGTHARVIQHEVDHLDGILYPMRMADMTRFGFVEELLAAAGEPG